MEMLGSVRKAKNMAFQSRFAWCSIATASLHHTYEYNFQFQNIFAVSNIPNNKTVNSATVSDALSNQSVSQSISQSIRVFGSSIDKTVVNNEYSELLYLFQIEL